MADDVVMTQEAGAVAPSRAAMGAERLASTLGVPVSVFAFLEARMPEIRAISEGRHRLYRAQDAVLLAGLTELLYREGQSFRDVSELMRTGGRPEIVARGRTRLRGALSLDELQSSAARRIPPDAVVRRKGGPAAPAETARAAPNRDVAAILADLIACVRLLEAAR